MINNKEILFRVDAGGDVGLGHFYRSVSLSKELNKCGWSVVFCHKRSVFWDKQILIDSHFTLEEDSEEENQLNYILSNNVSVFYLDGLIPVSFKFRERLKNDCKIIFHQNVTESRNLCDVFVLPAIHYDKSFFEKFDSGTQVYAGLNFVIINDELLSIRRSIHKKNKNINRLKLSILTGGSDPKAVTILLYEMLDFEIFEQVDFVFYLGDDFLHKDRLPNKYPSNVRFEQFDWGKIADSDLAISTFGVSTYELLFLSIPVLSIGHADSNAKASKKVMQNTYSIINLGHVENLLRDELNIKLDILVKDKKIREELGAKGFKLIDGEGVLRLASIINKML